LRGGLWPDEAIQPVSTSGLLRCARNDGFFFTVIPAKAGIQSLPLDARFREHDEVGKKARH
jgi:hypothetical protein